MAVQGGDGGHDDSLESRLPKRFLPFGDGPRACIGQNLARANYTATLAQLLSRFSFSLPEDADLKTVHADCENGELTVSIAKKAAAEAAKPLAIPVD